MASITQTENRVNVNLIDSALQRVLKILLARAQIRLNGTREGDMQIHDPRVFREVLSRGSLGLGESYMNGWWSSDHVDVFIKKLISSGVYKWATFSPTAFWTLLKKKLIDSASPTRSFDIGDAHYNTGNDLFKAMLDKRLAYTCGYWVDGVRTLDEAQEAKLDLVCRKIGLTPSFDLPLEQRPRILDIGCGWGSFAKFAAERYGVRVVGITVASEQVELGKQLCAGLPVEFRLQDYRDLDEQFDHIVSLGMFEHVEPQHYNEYFEVARRCLAPNGYFLLHTIGKYSGENQMDPWTAKYIFPVGQIPALKHIEKGSHDRLAMLDWHKFGGRHYDQTLMAWHANFAEHWEELKAVYAGKLNGKFERMWRYYLLSCAGVFRANMLDLWQIVYANELKDYKPIR